jgi:hypothetical protein
LQFCLHEGVLWDEAMSKKKQAKKLRKWEDIIAAMDAEEACDDPDCDFCDSGEGFAVAADFADNAEMRRQFALNAAMMALGGGPWGGARLDAATFLSTAAQIENYLKEGMKTAPTVPWDDRVK